MNILDHWRAHEKVYGAIDVVADPLGLQNVCIPTEPMWLNRYHDAIQTLVFNKLLDRVPFQTARLTALDIGCGAGRWSKRLQDRGFEVTGVDLQGSLIDLNRKRFPGIQFVRGDFRDFEPAGNLTLITSVTVLQHLPLSELSLGIDWLSKHLSSRGRGLFLENITDKSETTFGRSMFQWLFFFHIAGLSPVEVLYYDHSFCLKAVEFLRLRRLEFLRRSAAQIDQWIQPFFCNINLRAGARHAGFLMRKDDER